ncbi:class I SAM-dependent methyltransferase [Solidesulfovibrio sp.]|uniref:class I SAM-dependent methyltransferase n=1 Tax=Solidesulfovibrio sp. TaxID=2910990 RepID=UPI00262FADAB|nr:class I SAM-dependent methyltransferase [Solidesulfovibrio sp.]
MTAFTQEQLIATRPNLHRHGDGSHANWGVSDSVLRYIAKHSGPDAKTIETGAGLSSVAFVLSGAEHHAVFPEPYLVETLTAFLDDKGIDRSRLHLHNVPSQEFLPAMPESGFDIALIDGEHAFPIPFLDWYYIARRMKVGGLLIIDDTQIWTGQVLKTFLSVEPEWRLVWDIYGTSFFRLEAPFVEKWWAKQAYTVLHSQITPQAVPYLPEPVLGMLAPIYDTEGK